MCSGSREISAKMQSELALALESELVQMSLQWPKVQDLLRLLHYRKAFEA